MAKSVLCVVLLLFCILTPRAQQDLIPMPVRTQWESQQLNLSKGIVLHAAAGLESEAELAKAIFSDWGIPVKEKKSKGIPCVELVLRTTNRGDESYLLEIDPKGIRLEASTAKGMFYGLQTLRQFAVDKGKVQCAVVEDDPAFSWRAFLIDVGRNYQPMDMLKEQIDVMARYKLNVLHFHFTEDIAWRLASHRYPGLTDASNMTRWAGKYYTEAEFKELIAYCKERYITFLPEIDMPGHSAAFKRFFGVDMQSDSGMVYIKQLLQDFKRSYPELDILHIGGDEVKITNAEFMPEITKYVKELGYKNTIGWDPGSNLSPETWRQLWMGGAEVVKEEGGTVYIDSKHLYINHMDPLETVTTLFHRKIGGNDREHQNLKGATLCAWPDRAVSAARDMFYQNGIYPSILTFAERVWSGGGMASWLCNLQPKDTPGYKEFKDFERRLLCHKHRYFVGLPFPYVKQVGIKWDLIGPYDNDGILEKSFKIEKDLFNRDLTVSKDVEGGTVILRHWWADVVGGVIDAPKVNTTWYARTKIWSDEPGERPFWIGFNDLSRSYASDSPKHDTWDDRHSEVWVNQRRVAPPLWQQAGMKGDLEKPMIDEGYSFRAPTMIVLKKGWNDVLVKLPVGDFKGKSWQTPVKWMFTFVPIDNDKN